MNGQTSIQIDGQTVGLKFAYPAIKWFTEATTGSDIFFTPGQDSTFTIEGLAKLIQCSYKNYCLIKEVEPTLTYEAFYNYVEANQDTEEGQKELLRITEVYATASVIKKLIDAQKKSLQNGVVTIE